MGYAMEYYSIIKNDAPEGTLFWKHGQENFRTGSQLIVKESEEALFVRGGIIYEVFTDGTYSLTTDNYPIIDMLVVRTPFAAMCILSTRQMH